MDVTKGISDLLLYHNCVIIPGFGGFVCSYQPAQVHPVKHTIAPPSKAISFNRNLRQNDGLLCNYLSETERIAYTTASDCIKDWSETAIALLETEKELRLPKIGRIAQDVEGGWHFEPDLSVNYLTSSFGLPVVTAQPILRGKEVALAEKREKHFAPKIQRWSAARIAAALLLIAGIGFLCGLMYTGQVIEPLKLNQASVMNFLLHIDANKEATINLMPPPAKSVVTTEAPKSISDEYDTSKTGTTTVGNSRLSSNTVISHAHNYYIIVGVFASRYNIEKSKSKLLTEYPANALYEESIHGLTRVGYWAASDEAAANNQLATARLKDSTYWLLEK
jgi:CCDC81-like prokaryotic HU domain 1/CCDC81-like prokaryotic HU domain 2